MYRALKIAIVVPCYNEERLISKTVEIMPNYVDYILCINDGSKDNTLKVIKSLAKKNKRVIAIDNGSNLGVGATLTNGFKEALRTDTDVIGVMAGDAQCDPEYLSRMLDELIDGSYDYVKANRFVHRDALKQMPRFRRLGNIFITILTKFSTGYYSIFDTQNGYGVFTRQTMEDLSFDLIGKRYDYENTLLIALSIASAKIKDVAVPAIYGDEVSTIKFLPTATRALHVLWVGFWRRIYYKYILVGLHPIALFLFSGIFLGGVGSLYGLYLLFERVIHDASPSTGTVMLAVLPIILGFQHLLTAVTMDMNNEGRP